MRVAGVGQPRLTRPKQSFDLILAWGLDLELADRHEPLQLS